MTAQTETLLSCPACRESSIVPHLVLGDYRLGRCTRCGLVINRTFYEDPQFRSALFQPDYYDSNVAFEHRQDRFSADPSLPLYAKFMALIEQSVPPGRVLDVGCAFGNFLKLAQDRRWSPEGVELSGYSSAAARRTWGFDVFNGDLEEFPGRSESFDLVTFWDVIEHVPEPRRNLEKARHLLRRGGYVLLSTDNAAGLIPALGSAFYHATFGLWRYPARKFFIRFNSCFFDADNMRALLESCGFAVRHFSGLDYPLPKLNVSGLERQTVRGLYFLGRIIRRQSQFLMIAEAV